MSTFVLLRSLIIGVLAFIPPLMFNENGDPTFTDDTTMLALYGLNLIMCVITQVWIFKYYYKWRQDKYRVKYIKRLPIAHWVFFAYIGISFIIQALVAFMAKNDGTKRTVFIKPEWVTLIIELLLEFYFLFKVNCYVAFTTKDLDKPE